MESSTPLAHVARLYQVALGGEMLYRERCVDASLDVLVQRMDVDAVCSACATRNMPVGFAHRVHNYAITDDAEEALVFFALTCVACGAGVAQSLVTYACKSGIFVWLQD